MLRLQICPNCGELYDVSIQCNSDKCRMPGYDKRLLIEHQVNRIAKQLPAGSITFGTCQIINNDEARNE